MKQKQLDDINQFHMHPESISYNDFLGNRSHMSAIQLTADKGNTISLGHKYNNFSFIQ